MNNNVVNNIKENEVIFMKIVFIVTNNLELYSDIGFFFPALQKSRDISAEELINSLPKNSTITAYFDRTSAEKVLRHERKMALVDDYDNPKGVTYRSVKTPVILELHLINDLEVNENETQRIINKNMLDRNIPATVINLERGCGYTGNMPDTLNIENIDENKHCTIL